MSVSRCSTYRTAGWSTVSSGSAMSLKRRPRLAAFSLIGLATSFATVQQWRPTEPAPLDDPDANTWPPARSYVTTARNAAWACNGMPPRRTMALPGGSSGLKRDAWSAAARAEPAACSSGVVTLGPTRASVGSNYCPYGRCYFCWYWKMQSIWNEWLYIQTHWWKTLIH